jgi:predicted nucleic acid-binding Zn ribbon protein
VWRNPKTKRRCTGKLAMRSASQAEKAAGRASRRVQELIIAYECWDCGYWHIGHADMAQRIAHGKPFEQPVIERRVGCAVCKEEIPNGLQIYCSATCRSKMKRRKSKARKARAYS